MPISRSDVLEVVRDSRLHYLRFSVGPINVNAEEYDNVADYIESGAISVVPGSSTTASKYDPPSDTFYTRKTDPPLNFEVRSNILHECTHAISDINQVKVTRMMDEAAAYLAQLAYVSLINPSYEKPAIGLPMNNLVRQCMDLVAKYRLGEHAGQGVQILQSDISDLSHAVHAIPDYKIIPENEMLVADGVSFSDNQAEKFWWLKAQKVMTEIGDNRIRKEMEEMLTTKVRYVSHENYVTGDAQLLNIFQSYLSGGENQKKTVTQKLFQIFPSIDQSSAARYWQRMSTLRNGDPVSQRFQSGFPVPVKELLLSVLQTPR